MADAAVVPRGDGDTRVLAAYVVTDGRSTPRMNLDLAQARADTPGVFAVRLLLGL